MNENTQTDKKIEITIVISQKMKEKLYDEATRQGLTLNNMIDKMIESYDQESVKI